MRTTLRSCLMLTTATALAAAAALPAAAQDACGAAPEVPAHHLLPANSETVHWGYFSKGRAPQVYAHSGDLVTIETLTHHANDDAARMVDGDPGAESVFAWTADMKASTAAAPVRSTPRSTAAARARASACTS